MGASPRQPLRAGDGGFAFPVAILVLIVLALVSAAGLHAARSAYQTARTWRLAGIALSAADAGVARTLLNWATLVPARPAPGDSIVVPWQTLADGSLYRSVVYAPPVGVGETASPMVLLRTTGQTPPPGTARRTIVTWVQPAASGAPGLCCDAALKVQSELRVDGFVRNDPIPEVGGSDAVPPLWPASRCTAPTEDVPGVVSSDLGEVDIRRNGTVRGSPPLLEDASIVATDFTDFGSMTYADLAATADIRFIDNQRLRDEVAPVITAGACDTSVETNWGSPENPTGPCGDYFPMIHVAGNLTLERGAVGQGILLVDGDVDIEDDVRFYGLIIVQGALNLTDDARIYGAIVVAGGEDGGDRSRVDRRAKLVYSSCAVNAAQARFVNASSKASGRFWFEVVG